jgi:hypothetical protein
MDEKKTLIVAFLGRCNRYADDKLDEYRRRLAEASGFDALTLQDKIGHWTAYRAFNEFTIGELRTDALDHWFAEAGKQP